jgi:hypothetical protein
MSTGGRVRRASRVEATADSVAHLEQTKLNGPAGKDDQEDRAQRLKIHWFTPLSP